MNLRRRTWGPGWMMAGFCLTHVWLHAQPTNVPPRSQFPPPPVMQSPVDRFRDLLALEPAAQRAMLTNRSEEARKRLAEKIREYKALDPDERELRLQATELRWYLLQLMEGPPNRRAERLAGVREDLRPLIEDRLRRWDALPAEWRDQLLRNEQAISYLTQFGTASASDRKVLIAELPEGLRATMTNALARVDAMSEPERRRAFETLDHFLEMTDAEKRKVLRNMSAAEKQQMERALTAFGKLSPEQRKQCIRSYEQFAGLNAVERALFLRNVQQWEKMTPAERQQWRELVKNVHLLPPLPTTQPPKPPAALRNLPRGVATNRH